MNGIETISTHELVRLQEVERTWNAVFYALKEGNDDCFQGPGTGRDCALREIRRLQQQAAYIPGSRKVADFTLAELQAVLEAHPKVRP